MCAFERRPGRRARLKRLPLTTVAELGAGKRAAQISRLFTWSVAELVGEAGGAPQMPLNQLGLHRRAIARWLRVQLAYLAATEDLPASLQYTPHHELQSGAVEEEDEDEAAGAGAAIDLPTPDDEEGLAAPMCHCVPEQGLSVGWWRQLEPPPRPPRAEFEDRLLRGVRAPLRQPAASLAVRSWELRPGQLDPQIFDAAEAYVRACPYDDLVVRRYGQRGPFVHKSTTQHASPDRRHESVCYGCNRHVTYSLRGICDDPHLWPMNHM